MRQWVKRYAKRHVQNDERIIYKISAIFSCDLFNTLPLCHICIGTGPNKHAINPALVKHRATKIID